MVFVQVIEWLIYENDVSINTSKRTCQVWSTSFYMGKFGGPTPKRHRIWGNDRDLLQAVASEAGYMSREEQARCPLKTARHYVDRHGIKRCTGNKVVLKNSQTLLIVLSSPTFGPLVCRSMHSRKNRGAIQHVVFNIAGWTKKQIVKAHTGCVKVINPRLSHS